MHALCMYYGCMTKTVQVRTVPVEVHDELVRQAAGSGLSLNRFLLGEFDRIARRGRNAEVFARAAGRRGRRISAVRAVEAIRADRSARS